MTAFIWPEAPVQSQEEFLRALEQQYREVGFEGDFAPIANYWLKGTPLPETSRQQVFNLIEIEEPEGLYGRRSPFRSYRQSLANVIFTQTSPENWQEAYQRALMISLPILFFRDLLELAPRFEDIDAKQLDEEEFNAQRKRDFRQAIAQICKGEGFWIFAHEALVEHKAPLEDLEAIFEDINPYLKWYGHLSLMSIQCVAFLSGVVHQLGNVVESPKFIGDDYRHWYRPTTGADPLNYPRVIAAGNVVGLPLFYKLCYSAEAQQALLADEMFPRAFMTLWNYGGMAEYALANPDFYQRLFARHADKFTDATLNESLVRRKPSRALAHAQRAYKEQGVLLLDHIEGPHAIRWLVESLKTCEDSEAIPALFEKVAPYLNGQDFADLVLAKQDQGVPGHKGFKAVEDIEALEKLVHEGNEAVRADAAEQLYDTMTRYREDRSELDPQQWELIVELSRQYPDLFAKQSIIYYRFNARESSRWDLLWALAKEEESRIIIAKELCLCFKHALDEHEALKPALPLADKLFGQDPGPFFSALSSEIYDSDAQDILNGLIEHDGNVLSLAPRLALLHLSQSAGFGWSREPLNPAALNHALAKYPKSLAELDEKQQIKLLPYLDDGALVACAEVIVHLLETAKSKVLPALSVTWLSERSLNAIRSAGLLELNKKKAVNIINQALALLPDAGVVALLRERVVDKANEDFTLGQMLDRIESGGERVDTLDPWFKQTLADWQEEASGKKFVAAVNNAVTDRWLALCQPLGASLAKYLMLILVPGEGQYLPRQARQILGHLSSGTRMDLAEEACQIWIDQQGADKVGFLMSLVPAYGDEGCVNLLTKAVKSWCKKRKQKASAAIQWMAKVPGNFGIAEVKALHDSRKFSDSIMENAERALLSAAEQRGVSLEDLMDEIVPDFALSKDGLRLDLGPYCYQVKVLPDLSLIVMNAQGKATKSLPKAKDGEDAEKRGLAEHQFKALRKNLKPIYSQQAAKLNQAMQCAKCWTVNRWSLLFIEHPVLAMLAQGLSWSQVNQAGELISVFRPNEEGSLIDVSGNMLTLQEDAFVRVTHPVDVDEHTRNQWRQHFEEYAIKSPIDQWHTAVMLAQGSELEKAQLDRHQGYVIDRGTFGNLLQKWGYMPGPSGDGGRIDDHSWRLDNDRLMIKLHHTYMSAWFEVNEKIAIDYFAVYQRLNSAADDEPDWQAMSLGQLPKALLSTLLTQSEELANRGTGFQSNWRNL